MMAGIFQGSTLITGVAGKSAYESAVAGGFTGTEQEFNTALNSMSLVNDKIGYANDSGATDIDGTLMGKTNKILKDSNNSVAEIVKVGSDMKEMLGGEASSFGTASMGTVTYSSDFKWPAKDYYGRYVLQFQDFTVPQGVTMSPPEKCNGLYIYCKGILTIAGTIDMKGKRLTLDSDAGITSYIKINDVNYNLAKGGHTVKGGNGGYSGATSFSSTSVQANCPKAFALGGTAGNPTAGNINGGGSNNYGFAGIPYNDGQEFVHDTKGIWSNLNGVLATTGGVSPYRDSSGAIIIVAKTLNITSSGLIDCSAIGGVACINSITHSTLPVYGYYDTSAWITDIRGSCGRGTDGSQAPTGGGCITLITQALTNSGKLDTSGQYLNCIGDAVSDDIFATDGFTDVDDDHHTRSLWVTGAHAGDGGTFMSAAGEIKVYIV